MPRRAAGFTYVGLVVLVAILGLVGSLALKADALLRRAAAEEELLEIGAAFSAALQSYAAVTPRGQPTQPPTLQDLLKDPRFPEPRRHLRKIFVDPVTGKAQWGVVYLGDGDKGVLAVHSLSQARPLKVANFDARFRNFEHKEHISDWKFTANGQGIAGGAAAGAQRQAVAPQQQEPREEQDPHQEQAPPPKQEPQPPEQERQQQEALAKPPADNARHDTEASALPAPEPAPDKTGDKEAAAGPLPKPKSEFEPEPEPEKASER